MRDTITIQAAGLQDIRGIHALVAAGVLRGHLLPRSAAEIRAHLHRWVIARQGGRVVGCLSLEPTTPTLWEVRSVCVAEDRREQGIGHRMMDAALQRGQRAGVPRLFAVTAAHALFQCVGFTSLPRSAPEWAFVLRPIRECYQVVVTDLAQATPYGAEMPLLAPAAEWTHHPAPPTKTTESRSWHRGIG